MDDNIIEERYRFDSENLARSMVLLRRSHNENCTSDHVFRECPLWIKFKEVLDIVMVKLLDG